MLQDYEIKRKGQKTEKLFPYIEFVLILIILQAAIILFTGGQQEEGAIQFRLLAHSNAPADQQVKKEVQTAIAPIIDQAIKTSGSLGEIEGNLVAIETEILEIARSIVKDQPITLERKEALIPPKRSGFEIQPQSTYDAYILTIGSGRGDNWWCSLFPNVCFPEEAEAEVEAEAEAEAEVEVEEKEEEKVTFFLWEWIKGLFS